MAQRKSPSYPEWPVDRSVYSLFCGGHCAGHRIVCGAGRLFFSSGALSATAAIIARSRKFNTVEFGRKKKTRFVFTKLSQIVGKKHVSCLQNKLKRKIICIQSNREEVIHVIDLCCNMGYSLLRRGIWADF